LFSKISDLFNIGITLDANTWHARLYFWSLDLVGEFSEYSYGDRFKESTNLCHYVRTICFYMPLILLVNILFCLSVLFTFVVLPIYLFSFTGYLSAVVFVLGVVLVVLTYKKSKAFMETTRGVKPKQMSSKKEPGFATLMLGWVVAVKKKVCPIINFDYTGEQS